MEPFRDTVIEMLDHTVDVGFELEGLSDEARRGIGREDARLGPLILVQG